ncbi:hypothetical protein C900_02076 [Fulvivirga imtechensis AK7]|uniref:Uncharacterized protein n=1 Tax=Fulvivirga imtechensis AK7 TaxID=1237149 RepID=L8K2J4_9BACT|nr:DsrE family protein [Fulvivirga imtechensis]ELR73672.1 hypothetical protein C900_02076 [Fulvivirga imtechensis AK7]
MKKYTLLFSAILLTCTYTLAQEQVFPVIKNYGGIYDMPSATVKPDHEGPYKIVVDVVSREEGPSELSYSLVNVARLINLHAVGGVDPKNIKVVLAIHGPMALTVMNNDAYKQKFGVDNPHTDLYKALGEAGVKITICGQSLIARQISPDQVLEGIEIATSMLTTVTTYQLNGYVLLKF